MRRHIANLNHLNHRAAGAMAVLLLVVSGCRHADANRELVERELRLQEDELYRLHDEISDREKRLEAARRDNAVLERELQQARAGAAVPPELVPALPPAPTGPPPEREPRPDSGVPPIDVVPPTIEVPGLEGPQPPPAGRSSWKSTRGVRRASHEASVNEPHNEQTDELTEERHQAPGDDRVAKIVLDRRLTGGYDADRRLGDEGIVVVIEPRSEDDRLISQPGNVSVVVVDPALPTKEARVARWDFTADEVKGYYRKTSGDGIYLELPWPAQAPDHERLILFVRFTTPDGQIHEANQPILVDLATDSPDAGAD